MRIEGNRLHNLNELTTRNRKEFFELVRGLPYIFLVTLRASAKSRLKKICNAVLLSAFCSVTVMKGDGERDTRSGRRATPSQVFATRTKRKCKASPQATVQ